MDNPNRDPVCGMQVDRSAIISTYQDKTYYFCSMECKQKFDNNPELYQEKGEAVTGQL
jgi:YHS domain-containing protein